MTRDEATAAIDAAIAALKRKDYVAARQAIKNYAAKHALDSRHYLIKGLAELALEEWGEAAKTFAAATQTFPQQAQLWFNLGVAQENLGLLDVATASYEASLAVVASGEAWGNLSNIYRRLGRFSEAEHAARQACVFESVKPQALNSLGLALGKQGKLAAADQAFTEALAFNSQDASVLANRANLAIDRLDFGSAFALFAQARYLSDAPVIRRDEGLARLLNGDYAQGWQLAEARLELPRALRLHPACPHWRGENLAGKKLLLLAEQGFGDTIMFCRYAPFFAERGAELIWAVPKVLQRLLSANLPGTVCTESDVLPVADFYLPLLSAPYALGLPEPFGEKYLKAKPDIFPAPLWGGVRGGGSATERDSSEPQTLFPAERPPPYPSPRGGGDSMALPATGKYKIGLVWSGSKTHERDHERSIGLEEFAPLFETVDADFYAITPYASAESTSHNGRLIFCDHLIKDFADTAALLQQLDALISVDTSGAHLAGALGIPTWLLLPYCPDWRWGASGTTTPWYPSMILLRQDGYGNWETVIKQLINCIA